MIKCEAPALCIELYCLMSVKGVVDESTKGCDIMRGKLFFRGGFEQMT